MIAVVAVVVAGATGAFFSDTETSTGNTFTAGAIDLGIDNESYYNGAFNQGTSWELDFDVDPQTNPGGLPHLFFNFNDLKPGDYGEDTISLHVNNNEAWACVDVSLTKDDDVDCTEPENDVDAENGACDDPDSPLDLDDGELADAVEFLWWADDGDNVLEEQENVINSGVVLGALSVGGSPATVPLASPSGGVLSSSPLTGAQTYYIGKAWCFGDIAADPDDQDGVGNVKTPAGDNAGTGINGNDPNGTAGEPVDGGFSCSGASSAGNETQTDSLMADISFRVEQSRNNPNFYCQIQ